MRQPVKLPPCGMFFGSGIYPTDIDYLNASGRVLTVWTPQRYSFLEMLDKVIEDNQGNLAQLWAYSGGLSPYTFAQHHALEDIGVELPEPDWVNGSNLRVSDVFEPGQYAERFGAGVLKFVKAAAEKGIYSILLYTEANAEISRQFQDSGEFYLGYDFGEIFTFRLSNAVAEGKSLNEITLQDLADDLVDRVAQHVKKRHETGWGNVMATSGNFYVDYEIAAGADIPLMEDFAFSHLNMSSALSRGLYRQYHLPTWGAHLAHEHYSWIPYASPYKFPLLKAAMYHKYMAGCKILINESGNWFLQAHLVTDSPMFETPRVETGGSFRDRDPALAIPYLEEARKTYPLINYDSPVAKAYRKELSDFYDFLKENGTPEGQPETTIGLIKGDNDLCSHEYHPNGAIASAFDLAEQSPAWFCGSPERGWDIAKKVFYPRPPVLAPHVNGFLSGTPYGQVDIVSFARQTPSVDFLSEQYKALLFVGWNTANEEQYRVLTEYARRGGILFVSIPHLSKDIARNHNSYSKEDLLFEGDFSELCGVKVTGKGNRFYWITAPDRTGELGFEIFRRFGITLTRLGEIEITDPDAEVLAVEDESLIPFLIRRKLGRGLVYFLNSWAYPGALETDQGPGATVDSPGFIGTVYRHIAEKARGAVWITDDGEKPGTECEYIAMSFFPTNGEICLQNIDFDKARQCVLHRDGMMEMIELGPAEFRVISG